MASIVNERIAAFEEMSRTETANVKQFPVPKHSVGELISFFEHEVPARDGESPCGAQVVGIVVEASKAPTTPSEGSSYCSVPSHFEEIDLSRENALLFQNGASQKPVLAAGEGDATRLRRSQFIFHINAPATNISEAIARAERGRGLPGVKLFLSTSIRILKKATKGRPASSTAKEEHAQPSRVQPFPARNTATFLKRKITNTDRSTSAITPTTSESGEENGIGVGVEAEEGKIIAGKGKETNTTGLSKNKQASQTMRYEKSSSENTGDVRKLEKKTGKVSPSEEPGRTRNSSKKEGTDASAENPGHLHETTKAIGEKSHATNMRSVQRTAMRDGKEYSSGNLRNIPKPTTKADVEKSPTINTESVSNITKTEDKKSSPENTGSTRTNMMKGIKKSPATSSERASKTMNVDGNRSPTKNLGSVSNVTKKAGKKSPPQHTESVRKRMKTDDRKFVPAKKISVGKNMVMDQSTSSVTQTKSEPGDENGVGLDCVGAGRRKSLFYRLRAKLRQRRERKQRSEQEGVLHQFSRRVSSQSTTTIPIEVNVPYPKDATGPGNSLTATIHLKVSLTRNNE